jgi:hypothetical protein
MTVIMDPTAEQSPTSRERLARPDQLQGLTVGLLDISKPRGNVFLDRLDELLTERGIVVKQFLKDFDEHRKGTVTASRFKRELTNSFGAFLRPAEVELIAKA